MTDREKLIYRPEYENLGRSLKNYKEQQAKVATAKGVNAELQACKTLTKARQIVYGVKRSNRK